MSNVVYLLLTILIILFKTGHSQTLFHYFSSFLENQKQINAQLKLLMAGCEPGSSGSGSARSANLATTTALLIP